MSEKYKIGRGSQGTVYIIELSLGKMYALKRISFNDEGRENMRMITKIQTT
jgi:hypothetical protein